MIISAEIINQPYSGVYDEVIYDIPSTNWKSACWGWVKFINNDYTEWCGEFRGLILGVEISKRFNSVAVLTTDCLFILDRTSGKILDINDDEYNQITLSPCEEYILANSYKIIVLKDSINEKIDIKMPAGICSIKLLNWKEQKLILEFEDYAETGDFLNAALDATTYELKLI